LLLACFASCVPEAVSQEAARRSLAGETAAEARRQAAWAAPEPTLRLGTSIWKVTTGLDLEGNDNILFSQTDRVADLIIRSQVQTQIAWPLSEKNALNLALDAGYSAYAAHPEYNRFFVGPASELSFDTYVGDVWFRLHERVSVTENAYEDPTVTGSPNYSQLQNAVGLSATWDLNKVELKMAYDHTLYDALSGSSGFPAGDSDLWGASAGYRANAVTSVGLETGGGFISYEQAGAGSDQAANWNVGAFVEAQPMEYVRVRASAGYTVYEPQTGLGQDEFTGVYGQVALHHRVNRWVEYDLSGGRSVNFGYYEGTIDLFNVALDARWHLFQKLSLTTGLVYERGKQILAGHESFQRTGPRLSLERPITEKLWGALRYQFYHRESNQAGGAYEINIVTASIVYRL
jgi:hypothetical protein